MKRLSFAVIAAVLTQSLGAHAQLMDLPDPGVLTDKVPDFTPAPVVKPTPKQEVTKPSTPVAPAKPTSKVATAAIRDISTEVDGRVYVLEVKPATSIRNLQIVPSRSTFTIYGANLVSDRGEKIPLEYEWNKDLKKVTFKKVDFRAPIAMIELRLKSSTAKLDLKVQASSDDSAFELKLRGAVIDKPQLPPSLKPTVPAKPATPTKPVTPAQPAGIASRNGFSVGQKVVENAGTSMSVATITSISGDGRYLLSDGLWYQEFQLRKLVASRNGFNVGQKVVENAGTSMSFGLIKAISADGWYLLDDQIWYQEYQLKKSVASRNGFTVGQKVIETAGTDMSVGTIKAMTADGWYLLDDQLWYQEYQLKRIVASRNGFNIGQKVVETAGTGMSVLTIKSMTADGWYLLDDQLWYQEYQISRLVTSRNGFIVGQKVVETAGTAQSIVTIKAISANGWFLLSDNLWYQEYQLQKILR